MSAEKDGNGRKAWDKFLRIGMGGAFLALVVFIGYVLCVVLSKDTNGFGPVAALILVGLAAFLGIMNILSVTAHQLGIADAKQAFGLPEGSVRAILTMAFIVLVGVLASYLVTNSDGRSPYARDDQRITLSGGAVIDQKAAQDLANKYGGADAVPSIIKRPPAKDAQSGEPPEYDVYLYPRIDHKLGEDISKQILTILSTILAAMIGFYFGAKPGNYDPSATKRAQAMASLLSLLAGAPKLVADLKKRSDDLLKKDNLNEDTKQKVKVISEKLAQIEETLKSAQAKLLSIETTADEMQNAAETAKTASDGLPEIGKSLDALEAGS